MATIKAATEERVFTATTWLGLNQAGDGDTNLKMGESPGMINFQITPEGALKKRPGMKAIQEFTGRDYTNMWHGFVQGEEITVVSFDHGLLVYENGLDKAAVAFGFNANVTGFIGFENKLYMLCDDDVYRVYDGETVSEVVGYVPVVVINSKPAGGGTELQGINRLSKKRRVWFSPDGTSTEFILPEKNLQSIDQVVNRVTGEELEFTPAATAGKLMISEAPADGENTIEVTYTARSDGKKAVAKMRYAEIYNGTTDNRVFIYGDGTNQAFYSDLDYPGGNPRADYFPELNVLNIGDANTPITQMIRHYSRLLVFKTSSAYSVQYGLISTADNKTIPAFYWNPVNRSIGNSAPNMVCLVDNDPLTLFQHSIYRWANNGSYSSNLTIDERQARRISDKVWRTLEGFDLENAYCFDDNENKEWYCISDGRALVYAYGLGDVWYYYEDFPIVRMATINGELYGLRKTWPNNFLKIELVHISGIYRNDCGDSIRARWESGNMHFNADYRRKYSAMLWLGLVPLRNTELMVTVQTDRKTDFAKKIITQNMSSFNHANFAHWSFKTQRTPRVQRLKLKAKKFTYYKLILVNDSDASTAEVSSADIRVRYTGYVR